MNPFEKEVQILKDYIKDHIFLISTLGFIIFIFIGLYLPVYFVRQGYFQHTFYDTGQIGDTIGGIISPYIAIGASFLTFIAFWVQYQANKNQMSLILREQITGNYNSELNIAFDCIKNLRTNTKAEQLTNGIGRRAILNEIDFLIELYLNKYMLSYNEHLFPKDSFKVQINFFLNTLHYINGILFSIKHEVNAETYIISDSGSRAALSDKIEERIRLIQEQYNFLKE